MLPWEFVDDPSTAAAGWADRTIAALRELGVAGDVVAIDRAGTPAYLALASREVEIRDSDP
jgi:hypothetical protein